MSSISCAGAVSGASVFLQLSKRIIPLSAQSLDFLLPSRCYGHTSPPNATPSHLNRFRRQAQPAFTYPRLNSTSLASPRNFSTSSARSATICVRNPQTDEEGMPMHLEVTARAAKRLNQIMSREANPYLALRIQVESGGCHGFQYVMSLVTLPPDADEQPLSSSAIGEEDVIFQFSSEDTAPEVLSVQPGVPKVVLDIPSLDLLKGSKVDFLTELIGSEFKIVENPYAASSCGCGTSFDIKI